MVVRSGTCVVVAIGVLLVSTASTTAEAAARWRAHGSICSAEDEAVAGLHNPYGLSNYGYLEGTVCPIPTAPDLVELGDSSAQTLEEVWLTLFLDSSNASQTVYTNLFIHDYDSDTYCACDSTSNTYDAVEHFTETLQRDGSGSNCGGCITSYGDSGGWGLQTVSWWGGTSSGWTYLTTKAVIVFSDT